MPFHWIILDGHHIECTRCHQELNVPMDAFPDMWLDAMKHFFSHHRECNARKMYDRKKEEGKRSA